MDPISNDERKKLFSMFQSIDIDSTKLARTLNSDVLLIDGLNAFFRAFCASPSLNDNGCHVGGIAGFLQTIGYAIKLLKPTRVVIVFDGSGGSMKRRKIYPGYKSDRKTKLRYNRSYDDLSSEEQEEKNIQTQLLRLVGYLDNLPVSIISIDHVEADDTIAYAAREYFKDSNKVYIMSSDKDFLQLVDSKVNVWSPTKKKLYGCAEILTEYGISCSNFINFRVLTGDVSDNIPGIPGSGLKTILKCFPMLSEHSRLSFEDMYAHCESNKTKYKLYSTILKSKDVIDMNYQLMQLFDSQLQPFSQLRVHEILDKDIPRLDRIKFQMLLGQDRMWNNIPNSQVWLTEVFSGLNNFPSKVTRV